jgi:hypothetical protein
MNEPVAWRLNYFVDGWLLVNDEADAKALADTQPGTVVEPLYLSSTAAENATAKKIADWFRNGGFKSVKVGDNFCDVIERGDWKADPHP